MPAPLLDTSGSVSRRGGRRPGRPALGLVGVIALCGALVLGGCSDDGDAKGSSEEGGGAAAGLPAVADSEYEDLTGESEIVIDARDNTFGPQYVTVSPGTKITFSNEGRNPHNVIPVEEDAFPDIPTDELQPAAEAEITIDEAGDYPYYCSLHATPSRGMTGRIRVAEA